MPDTPELLNFCVGRPWPTGHPSSDGKALCIAHHFGVQVHYGTMELAERHRKDANRLGGHNFIYTLVPVRKPIENVTPEVIEEIIRVLLSEGPLDSVTLIEKVLAEISGSRDCRVVRLADWTHGNDVRRKLRELMDRGVIKLGSRLALQVASPKE